MRRSCVDDDDDDDDDVDDDDDNDNVIKMFKEEAVKSGEEVHT